MTKIYSLWLVGCLSIILSACGNQDAVSVSDINTSNKTNSAGVTGKNGSDGINGIAGKNGSDGMDGKNGIDGEDGKETQTIRFIETSSKYAFVGDQFTRTVIGGLGSGSISYRSDDPAVASIDATTGQVKILSTGTTLIWAHKSKDNVYSAANDFYLLSAVSRSIPLTARIGSRDTLLDFSKEANGLSLARSTNAKCNLGNISICQNAALSDINGSSIIDTGTDLNKANTYWLKHGDIQSRGAVVSSKRFSKRELHQTVRFNDGSGEKLWLIGGDDISLKNDVWSSSDGMNWVQQTASAAFSARKYHQVVTYNDGSGEKLWLIGGYDGALKNDVWSSSDGINWIQKTGSTEFSARLYHQLVNFNNGDGDRLWLIGGYDGALKNDVWSSSNGINWKQETANAAFSARKKHQVVNFNDGQGEKLWLIAGNDGAFKNDVWSSSNGINWQLVTANAAFSARYSHQAVSFDNGNGEKLWLTGGDDGNYKNDVWSSSDGKNWLQETTHAVFSARSDHQTVTFNDGSGTKLWVIAGTEGTLVNDVWSSSDGKNWTKKTEESVFSARRSHQAVSFNNGSGNKLWLIGGDDGKKSNDVWSSSDGISWTQETANAAFSERKNHQVIRFNDGSGDKLWLIGGKNGEYKSDVWSSSDAINWQQETASAAFSARSNHQVISFNDGQGDRLWLIGGDDGEVRNDIWSSSDGKNWQQETANAAFSARNHFQVVRFNDGHGDKLWLIGGRNSSFKNDVWSSSDGVNWVQQTASAAFSARKFHQVITFNDGSGDKIWLIGG
ncbi:MAG: hypothetical protein OEM07_05955, partial [Gammaproteobacteria bacterium]|nr:hypothetical protein [Gammaproteobacteria bacterium]